MAEDPIPASVQGILGRLTESTGGLFKFGPGLMGKSAILLGVLFVTIIVIAIWPSPFAFAAWVLGLVAFFVWYFPMLSFARDNPAQALLDGAEWRGWKEFEKRFEFTTARQLPLGRDPQPIFDPEEPPPPLGKTDSDQEPA